MSNFHDLEMSVIRHAEANGLLGQPPGLLARELDETLFELRDAIAVVDSVTVSDAMGRVAIDMIVLCAMLDIDLAKSLETAFNKISAKPVDNQTKAEAAMWAAQNQADAASNVVFLKQD